MNKKFFLLPLAALTAFSVVSCGGNKSKEKTSLDYGSYLVEEVTQITYTTLKMKMESEESFLLALYMSTTCGCWTHFKYALNQYINAYHVPVYYLSMSDLANQPSLGFTVITEGTSRVSLSIINEGKIANEWILQTKKGSDEFNKRFEEVDALAKVIEENAYLPNYYYVSESWLDENLASKDEAIVYFARAGCSDCNYASPNAYLPIAKGKEFKNKVFILDFQEFYDRHKNDSEYQEFKNKWGLSTAGNETYGYGNGVVPTSQYYEKGEIKDATVYFNDSVSMVDGKYVVTESYYTEERKSSLKYLDGVETTVLKGIELSEEDVTVYPEYGNYIAWNKDSSSKYHYPLLEGFLKKYAM